MNSPERVPKEERGRAGRLGGGSWVVGNCPMGRWPGMKLGDCGGDDAVRCRWMNAADVESGGMEEIAGKPF